MAVALAGEACAGHRPPASPPPARGATTFVATAYCQRGRTASGASVGKGVAAADPVVLPLGTVVRVQRAGRYDGEYTVLDTGSKVRGHRIDLFIRDCREATKFGRRSVRVSIVRRASESPSPQSPSPQPLAPSP